MTHLTPKLLTPDPLDGHLRTTTPDARDGEPRDMTGTAAHKALRDYWQVTPGGRNQRTPVNRPGDILTNLANAYNDRNAIHAAFYEARARRGWELKQSGMAIGEVLKELGIKNSKSLYSWWRRLGLIGKVDHEDEQ